MIDTFKYFRGADECFSCFFSYELIIEISKEHAKDSEFEIDKKLVLIADLPEGVFIRCQIVDLCEFYDELECLKAEGATEENPKMIEKMDGVDSFHKVTQQHYKPDELFGNANLGRWKIGFNIGGK